MVVVPTIATGARSLAGRISRVIVSRSWRFSLGV
jgi:hypothetical protein